MLTVEKVFTYTCDRCGVCANGESEEFKKGSDISVHPWYDNSNSWSEGIVGHLCGECTRAIFSFIGRDLDKKWKK